MKAKGSHALTYAQDAMTILRVSLSLARASLPVFYRVAAVQLRLLLCDTVRQHGRFVNTALLPQIIPGLELFPLDTTGVVDRNRSPISLPFWLEQPLAVDGNVSIRTFIRRVCDRHGGAHVDLRDAVLPEDIEDERHWIILLGDALSSQIDL